MFTDAAISDRPPADTEMDNSGAIPPRDKKVTTTNCTGCCGACAVYNDPKTGNAKFRTPVGCVEAGHDSWEVKTVLGYAKNDKSTGESGAVCFPMGGYTKNTKKKEKTVVLPPLCFAARDGENKNGYCFAGCGYGETTTKDGTRSQVANWGFWTHFSRVFGKTFGQCCCTMCYMTTFSEDSRSNQTTTCIPVLLCASSSKADGFCEALCCNSNAYDTCCFLGMGKLNHAWLTPFGCVAGDGSWACTLVGSKFGEDGCIPWMCAVTKTRKVGPGELQTDFTGLCGNGTIAHNAWGSRDE